MKNYFPVLFIFVFFLFSCEKELDFKYHEIEPQFVIEGTLSQEGVKVTLSLTTPMNEKIEPDYITDGEVTLIDEATQSQIKLETDLLGIYTSEYTAKTGSIYRLEVRQKGKEYISRCEMRPATEISGLKFQWIKMPYDYVAVLQIAFKDLENQDDCYWIKIYRNDEPYKWIMSDDRGAVNGTITEVIMTSRMDLKEEDEKDILRDGDEVKVVINAISREMYDYLIAIENDSNGPRMFDGDFCLGYFIASDSVSDTIIFHPDELTHYE